MKWLVLTVVTVALLDWVTPVQASPITVSAFAQADASVSNSTGCGQSVFDQPFPATTITSCSDISGVANAVANTIVNTSGLINLGGSLFFSGGATNFFDYAGITDSIRVFSPTVTNGFLRLSENPSGDITINCATSASVLSASCAFNNLSMEGDIALYGSDYSLLLNATAFQGGTTDTVFLSVGSQNGSTIKSAVFYPVPSGFILVPIQFGNLFVTYTSRIGATGDLFFGSALGSATASVSDPPIIEVLDSNLQPVTDATITSASGINYGPLAAIAPVPEPASLLLLGTGLVATVSRFRRGRPTSQIQA